MSGRRKPADFEGMSLSRRISAHWRREEGQTMAEYAVVLGIITPALVLALGLFSEAISSAIAKVSAVF
jgi:Flp pilus assembly pilin Flp